MRRLIGFLCTFDLKSSIKDKTCFKSLNNPSCIDILVANNKPSFKTSLAISTDLTDIHKMIVTVMNTNFTKSQAREIRYWNYNKFDYISLKYKLRSECNVNYSLFLFFRC